MNKTSFIGMDAASWNNCFNDHRKSEEERSVSSAASEQRVMPVEAMVECEVVKLHEVWGLDEFVCHPDGTSATSRLKGY